ncbi:DsbA family protein [Phytoactinopolyspora endophytica]|uniref:DsbA family protein n=1 Tax=Phytoactinopolyspora endophytica TaxID=1642495 RepID=UPI00101D390F|nr:DsbA family protein [Phytoactinopolyspora endophytica]
MNVKLTYVFDAYCGWCYGFGPAVRDFAAANAGRVELDVVSGGLFTGAQVAPIGTMTYVAGANARIAALTGVEFGTGYHELVADGRFEMDSTAAATGFAALRAAAPDRALESAEAMQWAFYFDGLSLSEASTYRHIAEQQGLDADAVVTGFVSPTGRTAAAQDFTRAARLGVTSYPTLLLHTDTGVIRLGGPASTEAQLTNAIDRHLAHSE